MDLADSKTCKAVSVWLGASASLPIPYARGIISVKGLAPYLISRETILKYSLPYSRLGKPWENSLI